MNITSITGYTPNRQAQKVSFGDIYATNYVKRYCNLSDDEISKLNKKCPQGLDVYVEDTIECNNYYQRIRAEIYYNCNNQEESSRYFDISLINRGTDDIAKTKQANKENFMKCINEILNEYNKQ